MVKLHTIGKTSIVVWGRDHRPAHFHVTNTEGDAMIDIETLTVMRGTLPGSLFGGGAGLGACQPRDVDR